MFIKRFKLIFELKSYVRLPVSNNEWNESDPIRSDPLRATENQFQFDASLSDISATLPVYYTLWQLSTHCYACQSHILLSIWATISPKPFIFADIYFFIVFPFHLHFNAPLFFYIKSLKALFQIEIALFFFYEIILLFY